MNASDIVKAKQNKTLFQAYYRPTIFPGIGPTTDGCTSTLIVTDTSIEPVSSISIVGTSYVSTSCTEYLYTCNPAFTSYNLLNDVNSGKYLCGSPYCSSISIWNTGTTIPTGTCNCKISYLTWKNTNETTIYMYSTLNYSSIYTTSTNILTGPSPTICPDPMFYQGNSVPGKCMLCNIVGLGIEGCCASCARCSNCESC